MTMLDLINITVGDVKMAMGIPADETTYDTQIADRIKTRANFILEDYFTSSEVQAFTPNQRERARLGLATYLAGEILATLTVNPSLSAGSSFSLGPISLSGWGGGGGMSNLGKVAAQLKEEGKNILDSLRLAGDNGKLLWGVVGTNPRPTIVGRNRYRC